MRTIAQITYQARTGSSGMIFETAASFSEQATSDLWWQRLEPWLRVGKAQGSGYLNFGSEAAFIRWHAEPLSQFDWDLAHVLVGPADVLTGRYALELGSPDPPAATHSGKSAAAPAPGRAAGRVAIETRARSAQAIKQLTPLLAHALHDEQQVMMPWTRTLLPEAIMWGLLTILEMMRDPRLVSFLTYVSSPRWERDAAGLFVAFQPNLATMVPPDPGFTEYARDLTEMFARDPEELRRWVELGRAAEPGDAVKLDALVSLPLAGQDVSAGTEGTTIVNPSVGQPDRVASAPADREDAAPLPELVRRVRPEPSGDIVRCPMCLHEIENWNSLDYWRWNPRDGEYVELKVDADLNKTQLDREVHGASVRCPSPQGEERIGAHYLPADYGRFGAPVVLGFVGLTRSGKSHLLASMVGAIMKRDLASKHGISCNELDHSLHRRYLDTSVNLLKEGKVLPGTNVGIVEFADAFLVKRPGGPERVVALFDVAGDDLARLDETKEFLWIADGLFFVIDSDRLTGQWTADETFGNVLDVVRKRVKTEPVSAAIVLNKADLLRFDEPVDRWLRSADVGNSRELDALEFLRETADVYAFLDRRNALAMAEPYEVCGKATMHIASPTGGAETGVGDVYPRGVTPRRVLRPLVAMLAMTGVLTGPDAEQVGV